MRIGHHVTHVTQSSPTSGPPVAQNAQRCSRSPYGVPTPLDKVNVAGQRSLMAYDAMTKLQSL